MDEFLADIHFVVFKKWLILKYKFEINNENTFSIENSKRLGIISFYDDRIAELKVFDKYTHKNLFYLHFRVNSFNHTLGLFEDMMKCLYDHKNESSLNVLLCCSGGYTSSYFALKIEEAVKLLGLNIDVNAVGYNRLYQYGHQYDVILLAPQISYMYSNVRLLLKNKVVLKIPPKVFASYDVGSVLNDFLREYII